MTPGRKPSHQPKTAYNVRRYMTLVEVLALGGRDKLLALCEAWGVEPYTSGAEKGSFLYWETLRKLAQHVIEYHRSEAESEEAK